MKKLLSILWITIISSSAVLMLKNSIFNTNNQIKIIKEFNNKNDGSIKNSMNHNLVDEHSNIKTSLDSMLRNKNRIVQDEAGITMIKLIILELINDFIKVKLSNVTVNDKLDSDQLINDFKLYSEKITNSSHIYAWDGTEIKWHWFGGWRWYMTWNWLQNKIGHVNIDAGLAATKASIIKGITMWFATNDGVAAWVPVVGWIAGGLVGIFIASTAGCIMGNEIWRKSGIVIRYYALVLTGCWDQ